MRSRDATCRITQAARSPTAARSPAHHPHRARDGHRHRGGVLRPRRGRALRGAPRTRRSACPAPPPGDTYLRGDADHRRGAGAPAPTRCTPATASCPRTLASPAPAPTAGLTFVGPPPEAIEAMGSKIAAKELMAAAGVPVLPGVTVRTRRAAPVRTRPSCAAAVAEIGYPVLVKAAFGGGGRGMRIVTRRRRAGRAPWPAARREAASAFGDGTVFLERYVDRPRHIEVQILGDSHGTVVHLFERECSIQRRYQKIIEEAPVACGRRAAAGRAGRGRGGGGQGDRLRRRGHGRVRPGRRRRVLLPGGEHPAAGGAPGDRAGHRPRPGRAAAGGGRGHSHCRRR